MHTTVGGASGGHEPELPEEAGLFPSDDGAVLLSPGDGGMFGDESLRVD